MGRQGEEERHSLLVSLSPPLLVWPSQRAQQRDSRQTCRFILPLAVFLAGCTPWSARQLAPAAPPVVVTEPPGPYLHASPTLIQPAPGLMPVFPPQSTVVPLPSHAPGSIFGPPLEAAPPGALPQPPVSPLAEIAPGGMVAPQFGLPAGPDVSAGLPNPLAVPVADDDYGWDQLADVVSDYFTIANEERVRRGPEVFAEGRIETAPQGGATWLEPHRGDSVGSFNRWESTFQTIRRRALVRVLPDAAGYNVEVIVEKEIENLPRPEQPTAGAATFRNDNSLPSRRTAGVRVDRTSRQWIPLGRDLALEQRMLADIHARLSGVTTASSVFSPPQ